MDIVRLGSIPSHYWSDLDDDSMRKFAGCYGLVTFYPGAATEYDRFFAGDRKHLGWVSPDGDLIFVLSRRIEDDRIWTGELWVPSRSVVKLPLNVLILNIFAQYPWQVRDADGPGCELFVHNGMQEFDHIKNIIEARYEALVEAHEAAMAVMKQKL